MFLSEEVPLTVKRECWQAAEGEGEDKCGGLGRACVYVVSEACTS